MKLKLDDKVICEVVTQQVKGGVTYALIRPDGRSEIYARHSYLIRGISSILREAVYEQLEREEKFNTAAS
jgi:hypothetical protein